MWRMEAHQALTLKARCRTLQEVAYRNKAELQEFALTIEQAKVRKREEDECKRQKVLADAEAKRLEAAQLDADPVRRQRHALLFGRPLSAGLRKDRKAGADVGKALSARQYPQRQPAPPPLYSSQAERVAVIRGQAAKMRIAGEEARAERHRILFGAPGGPAGAARAWCEAAQAQQRPPVRGSTFVVPRLPRSTQVSPSPWQPVAQGQSPAPSASSCNDGDGDETPPADGNGNFWRRVKAMEDRVFYHSEDLARHRAILDDALAAQAAQEGQFAEVDWQRSDGERKLNMDFAIKES